MSKLVEIGVVPASLFEFNTSPAWGVNTTRYGKNEACKMKKKKELIVIGFREAFRPSNLLCLNLVALLACFRLSFSGGRSREKVGGWQAGEKKIKEENKRRQKERASPSF